MNTSFERVAKGKDEWLTPPNIISALGQFDLDPCAPEKRPWNMASNHYSLVDDGLRKPWIGRVWMNPPYGTQTARWMRRLAEHGNGIALTFARTETKMFFESIWGEATAILFLRGRLRFFHVDGTQADSAGAPSCLVAYGEDNAMKLRDCGLPGQFIRLRELSSREQKGER